MPALRRFLYLVLVCTVLLSLGLIYDRRLAPIPFNRDAAQAEELLSKIEHVQPVDESQSQWIDVFPPGKPKPAGSEYTRNIVMSRMSTDDVSWLDEELSDILYPAGPFNRSIYAADDRKAQFHTKKNKGHEVMTYLTYIIDNYDSLADVTIFVHADRWAWHNNPIMDDDMAAMLRYLKPEKVIKDGYYNLRCQWDPGCPHWLFLRTRQNSAGVQRKEEKALAEHWSELFPMDDMPSIVSQPCCAQFAVSRDRLRAIPKGRYIYLRSWVLRTPLDDYRSGRVFEYLWQYIFTGNAEVCPAMHKCYCDGYGMCFKDDKEFNSWFELRYTKSKHEEQIERWQAYLDGDTKVSGIDSADESGMGSVDRMAETESKVSALTEQMQKLRDDAFVRGHPEGSKW
jgi:hypothetical protein